MIPIRSTKQEVIEELILMLSLNYGDAHYELRKMRLEGLVLLRDALSRAGLEANMVPVRREGGQI
jgi:hypothetical protein